MKRLVLPPLAAVLLLTCGCHMFSSKKNPSAPKESPTVATDVENDFMHRWIDKRASELAALGMSQAAARAQAEGEFKAKFPYTDAARSAK
jgi:hypothetical protein